MSDAVLFNSPRITLDKPKPLSYLENIAHKKVTNLALTCFESLVHWFLTTFSCFYPAYDKLYKAEVAKLSVVNDKKSNAAESEDGTPLALSPNRESAIIEDASLRLPTATANPTPALLPNQATAVAEAASLRLPIVTDKPAEGIADDAAAQKFGTLPTGFEPIRVKDFGAIQTIPPAPVAPPAKEGNIASTLLTRDAIDIEQGLIKKEDKIRDYRDFFQEHRITWSVDLPKKIYLKPKYVKESLNGDFLEEHI